LAGTGARGRDRSRFALSTALSLFLVGNAVGVIAIWGGGGADGLGYHWHSFADVLLGLGRIAALLAGYLALIEVLLLARLPFVERLVGFDRLTVWHRWNGHAVIDLVLAHVVFSVWGYANVDKHSFFREYWDWLTLPQPSTTTVSGGFAAAAAKPVGSIGGKSVASIGASGGLSVHLPATSPYPGIITATVGTALLLAVVVSSLVVVRRKLSYEWWYAIHFTAYAGIALAWFHMIPDGNEFVIDQVAADYWRGLYALALALVLYYRVTRPLWRAFRFDLRVTDVVEEGPGVVSLRISGRDLDRLGARAGQFFFWRFLAPGFWYTQHPFSLSEAPAADSFRITVKSLGDHTARFGRIPVGTRVFAEGPFGVFTDRSRVEEKSLLIAGGIGITPVRALLEQMGGDLVALYRVVSAADIVLRDELDEIAAARGVQLRYLVGDHASEEGRDLLSPRHLEELVPDIAERDVYVCGPAGMVNSILPNLVRAKVPRRHLHVERFAL
jgi:predicted ferric reductase